MIARRFWPHVDDGCLRLMQLLDGWRSRGIEATVLTARWHSQWPEKAMLRECHLHRLLPSPRSNWNESQFQKNVVAWIGKHVDEFDAIYVDRADGLLAAIAAKCGKWNKPLVTRFSLEGEVEGVARSQQVSPVMAAEACRRTDAVVVPNSFAQRVLLSHGFDERKIVNIPDTVEGCVPRDLDSRNRAAGALFDVSSDFVIPGRTDLLLHLGNADAKSLVTATRTVCDLLDQGASLRMWIINAGQGTQAVFDQVKNRGWHREILLFDAFDDLEELVAVADLAIVSNPDATLQFSVPLMMNSELPMVIAESVESKNLHPETLLMKYYDSQESLQRQLKDWLVHRQQWLTEAMGLRASYRRHRPHQRTLDQWGALYRDLASSSSGTRSRG